MSSNDCYDVDTHKWLHLPVYTLKYTHDCTYMTVHIRYNVNCVYVMEENESESENVKKKFIYLSPADLTESIIFTMA